MTGVIGRFLQFLKVIDLPVKLCQIRRIERPQNKVAYMAVLFPFSFDIDFRAIVHILLGQIEHVTFRIMGADTGEGAIGGSFDQLY